MKKILFIGYAWVVLRGLMISLLFLFFQGPSDYFDLIHECIGHVPTHSFLLYLFVSPLIGLCGAVLYFGVLKNKRFVRAWTAPYLVLLIAYEAYGVFGFFKKSHDVVISSPWLFVFAVVFSALNVYHVYINRHVLERDYKRRGNADSLVLLLGIASVASIVFAFEIPLYFHSLAAISSWFIELEGHRAIAFVALGLAFLRIVYVYRRHGKAASWFVWVGIFFSFLALQVHTVSFPDPPEVQAPVSACPPPNHYEED